MHTVHVLIQITVSTLSLLYSIYTCICQFSDIHHAWRTTCTWTHASFLLLPLDTWKVERDIYTVRVWQYTYYPRTVCNCISRDASADTAAQRAGTGLQLTDRNQDAVVSYFVALRAISQQHILLAHYTLLSTEYCRSANASQLDERIRRSSRASVRSGHRATASRTRWVDLDVGHRALKSIYLVSKAQAETWVVRAQATSTQLTSWDSERLSESSLYSLKPYRTLLTN